MASALNPTTPSQRTPVTGHLRAWFEPHSSGRTSWADEPDGKPDPVPRADRSTRAAAIHLGTPLPTSSSRRPRRIDDGCGLPGSSGGPPSNAACLTLLQVGFTEPHRSPGTLVVSYTTVSPLPIRPARRPAPTGGLFSVALSRGSPRVGVTHHLALWSPDFPRRGEAPTRPPVRLVRTASLVVGRPDATPGSWPAGAEPDPRLLR